jgi:hypothetical protein
VGGSAELVVRINGAEALRTKLGDAGGPAAAPTEINRDFTVDLPAGKRRIEIANLGAEWLILDSLRLDEVRPAEFPGGWHYAPGAVGLRRGAKAVLYVCSPWTTWPAGAFRFSPALQTNQSLRLTGWPAGRFIATWFDPSTGARVGTTEGAARDDLLTLPLPAFGDDLAGIVSPAPTAPPRG